MDDGANLLAALTAMRYACMRRCIALNSETKGFERGPDCARAIERDIDPADFMPAQPGIKSTA